MNEIFNNKFLVKYESKNLYLMKSIRYQLLFNALKTMHYNDFIKMFKNSNINKINDIIIMFISNYIECE